jgi:anti-sigma regulatory factor (Ser/Thr protein kinase)
VAGVRANEASSVVLAAETEQVAVARRFVRRTLTGVVPDEVASDLQLIVSELFTNAVEHGDADRIGVTVDVRPGAAQVTVDSRSPAPEVGPVETWSVADENSIDGRGLGIVRRLADVLDVEHEPGRLLVSASRVFPAAGS